MGSVATPLNWILRVEGLMVLILALAAYASLKFSWLTFVIFFLAPDISFMGYLVSKKVGAISYNVAHSYIGAMFCLGLGYFLDVESSFLIGIIWIAHIGFDRALGYGLKYSQGFTYTHLGRIGKASAN